jgi:hypothetical protein
LLATVRISTAILAAIFVAAIPLAASATTQESQVNTHSSTRYGITANYPTDWAVDTSLADKDDIIVEGVQAELGYWILAVFCPRDQALPSIGGKFDCSETKGGVPIYRFTHLEDKAEFSGIENITLDDLLAYFIETQLRGDNRFGPNFKDIEIVEKTDTKVGSLPAQLVELTYKGRFALGETRGFLLMTLDGTTGYALTHESSATLTGPGELPSDVKTIFDSFRITSPSSGAAAPA